MDTTYGAPYDPNRLGSAHGRDRRCSTDQGRFIGIGWAEMGDLSRLSHNRDAFKARFAKIYPNVKPGAVPVQAGVLFRFVHEISVDDVVVYPSKPDRMVNLGVVRSEYTFEPAADAVYPHRRRVQWVKSVPRADFSQSALHEIGSAITLFLVTTHAGRVPGRAGG